VLIGHNNTLNVSRAFLGAPLVMDLCKTGFRGSPCCRHHAARADIWRMQAVLLCSTTTKVCCGLNGWINHGIAHRGIFTA
jgi:hypothetical protein